MRAIYYSSMLVAISFSITSCKQEDSKNIKNHEVKSLATPAKNLTAMDNYNLGYKAYHSADFKNAIRYYRKSIQLDPKNFGAYDNCGVSYRRVGNLDSAVYFYKESIKLYPKGSVAHGNLAIVYAEKGELQNSINEYQEISKHQPNDPEGPYGIAGIYLQTKQYDKALIAAKKSATLFEKYQPKYVGDAYYYMGLCYLKLNDKSNASEYIKKAAKKGTKIPGEILNQLGSK